MEYDANPSPALAWAAVVENKRLAYWVANRYARGSKDDVQDAMIALHAAFLSWDLSRSRGIRQLVIWKFTQCRTDFDGPLCVARNIRGRFLRWERSLGELKLEGQAVPLLPDARFGLPKDLIVLAVLRHAITDSRSAEDAGRHGYDHERLILESCTTVPVEREDLLNRHLQAAWTATSYEDQQLLLARYVDDKTLREIGAPLELSNEGVRMRIQAALSRLRAEFVNQGRMTREDFELRRWRKETYGATCPG